MDLLALKEVVIVSDTLEEAGKYSTSVRRQV